MLFCVGVHTGDKLDTGHLYTVLYYGGVKTTDKQHRTRYKTTNKKFN